ncbi:hypothetical protein BH11PSE9_BH11PSE9_38630 [soil metagenome]
MGLGTRRRTRVVMVLLAALAAAAVFDGTRLAKANGWNDMIAAGTVPADVKEAPRQVLFARAYVQSQAQVQDQAQVAASGAPSSAAASAPAIGATPPASAASSAEEAALHGYRSLQDDSPLGQAARYNSANLLMRQAVIVRASTQPGQAITLVELAKEMYRDVLRDDPQHWAARYNLERAQRLVADPEEAEALPVGPERNAERAATTMRGYSPGLP